MIFQKAASLYGIAPFLIFGRSYASICDGFDPLLLRFSKRKQPIPLILRRPISLPDQSLYSGLERGDGGFKALDRSIPAFDAVRFVITLLWRYLSAHEVFAVARQNVVMRDLQTFFALA